MKTNRQIVVLLLVLAAALAAAGCNVDGQVEQGRVIAYDKQTKIAVLIAEENPTVPLTVKTPEDSEEMGQLPTAGKLMSMDTKAQKLVIFDAAAGAPRTIPYSLVKEKTNVAKAPTTPALDRTAKTISVYLAKDKKLITFVATDDLLTLPADTWRFGDVVRYYYQDPHQALRMMNVTKTDLNKAGT
jgi:hypothetical protein